MKNSTAKKRKQVPVGYLVVGVDPHKKKHAAVFVTQDFMTHSKLKFDNSREGFETVLERARTEMLKTECRGVIFAIETGAHHWRNLAYFLDEKGIPLRLINQFTLKRRREGKDLNHRKNDYRDSEVAAQLLCTGEFNAARLSQGVYAELRAAYGSYRRLVKEKTRTVNLVKSLLDGLFPEFTQVFKNPCGQTAASVLCTCAVPQAIAGMTESEFAGAIKAACQGRVMKGKLRVLHHVAMTSISKQGRPVLRHCAWTAVIPMLRFNPDFRDWAKKLRERPAGANPLSGREVMVAAVNKLLRLAFALVKNQALYQIPEPQPVEIAI